MSDHFTSDLHLWHSKVSALRGFGTIEAPDVEAHADALCERWIERVRPKQVIYVLGDISGGSTAATRRALATLATLPGRKRLIAGNHDPVHPMNRKAHAWGREFAEVFEFVAPFARVRVEGIEAALSHFPFERDRGEPRYLQWRLRNEGLPLLHGHTHGKERLTHAERSTEVHVGVDAWDLAPVSGAEVSALLQLSAGR